AGAARRPGDPGGAGRRGGRRRHADRPSGIGAAADRRRRPRRRECLGTGQLAGRVGASSRRPSGQRCLHHHDRGRRLMSYLVPLDTAEGLSAFGHDPAWLVIVKAVLIFVILVLLTLFNIWWERRVV